MQPIETGPCVLRGRQSRYSEFDFDKRRHYACSNEDCGEYVITDTACAQIELAHRKPWRDSMMQAVRLRSATDKVPEIWVDPKDKRLSMHLVDRPR